MKMKYYFDYNATTPVDPRVVEEMTPFFSEIFHNPSSFYRLAGEARYRIEQCRVKVAELINGRPDEIYFTSGGTESDTMAIMGVANKGNHIITSSIEHPAVLHSCKYLEKKGYRISYLPVDHNGLVDPGELRKNITTETILVSIMHANNEIGTIQPIKELVEIAHQNGVLFHTDAVQSAGKILLDVKDLDIDLLSLSSHKIYGPKGVGVLFKKGSVDIEPLIFGGDHEKGLRAGTENVPGIVGLGKAAELVLAEREIEEKKLRPMRDRLQRELTERIPEILINCGQEPRLYNTLNISIRFIEGESILALLDQDQIALSSGSACSSKSPDPSHVLLAIGMSHEDAHGSLRISLGKFNTDDDIDVLIDILPRVAEKLRKISPFWSDR